MSDFYGGPNAPLIGRPDSRSTLGTPALILDIDRLDANIRSMADHAARHGYQIRACAKIHKSVEIARRQVRAGAVGICCATLSEAEAFVAGGISGVMLFTSVVTEPKLRRLATLNTRATDLIVVADDPENVIQLGEAVRATGKNMQVMIDFELGGRRTGVPDESRALSLAKLIRDTIGLEFVGVQAYNGRGLSQTDYQARKLVLLERLQRLSRLVEVLDSAGLHPRIVSGGGTGSHDIDPASGLFTEIQAGTYVFMDLYYKDTVMRQDDPHPFQHSLFVKGTVISAAQLGFVMTDVGLKEVDGANTPLLPTVFHGAPVGSSYSLAGDDLGRIDFLNPEDKLSVGATFELVPPHCYQTAALYSTYHCVSGEELVDIWPIEATRSW